VNADALLAAVGGALAAMPDPVASAQAEHYERELAAYFGTRYAVAVASGTAALHCALAGTSGDAGCFSTKDGKLLWSGEGGFNLTDDPGIAARCRAFRTHWQTPPAGQAPLSFLGYNYRLAEPLAAIASANLARFGQLLARRQQQTRLLSALITGSPAIEDGDG